MLLRALKIIALWACLAPTAHALDTGFVDLTTFADDASVGTQVWSNPTSAATSNDVRASVGLAVTTTSHYLRSLQLVSPGIPGFARIVGIEARFEKFVNAIGGVAVDSSIRLFKNGVPAGTNKSVGATWPNSDTYVTYGGPTDLWGLELTAADVTASNFGVGISASQSTGAPSAQVDHVQIKVYYDNSPFFLVL